MDVPSDLLREDPSLRRPSDNRPGLLKSKDDAGSTLPLLEGVGVR